MLSKLAIDYKIPSREKKKKYPQSRVILEISKRDYLI